MNDPTKYFKKIKQLTSLNTINPNLELLDTEVKRNLEGSRKRDNDYMILKLKGGKRVFVVSGRQGHFFILNRKAYKITNVENMITKLAYNTNSI